MCNKAAVSCKNKLYKAEFGCQLTLQVVYVTGESGVNCEPKTC